MTYALSILLNLALFTSSHLFPFNASVLTSLPMCSPSRSQSVHMKRALAPLAWDSIFLAIGCLSFKYVLDRICPVGGNGEKNLVDSCVDGGIKEALWRRVVPVLDLWTKFSGSKMARYASHDNLTISPWRTKVECERIVFDILIPSVGLERRFSWRRYSSSPRNLHLPW